MTTKVGIRELSRNLNMLDEFDYIEVEDKKTHQFKGLFISSKYAKEFKEFLDQKISKDQQEKLDRLYKFAGKGKIHERFKDLDMGQIRQKIAEEKYGN